MTIVEEIIAAHAGRDNVQPGDLVSVTVDRVYVQDGNSPTIAKLFDEHGFTTVFDSESVGIFFDHSVIAPDIAIANRLREAHDFAKSIGVKVYAQGEGISHVIAFEEGWFQPGSIVLGSDSHTCTGGALQSLALGMGASDITAAMVTGRTWLKVPETIWIRVHGTPHSATRAKDIMLHILAAIGQERFLYRSVEFTGSWAEGLSLDAAGTVASLGVELGAKCVFLPDGVGRPTGMRSIDIENQAAVINIDIEKLAPVVAKPHSPLNVVPLSTVSGEQIDYVFVGSCTNSRFEDIAEVAMVLKGHRIPSNVHCLVTPGSRQVYLHALEAGHIATLIEAGAIVTPPGCGSCLGTQGSIPADGDRVVSTMNRNFLGRMGNPKSENTLASPLVAAHCAKLGRFPSLEEIDQC